MTAKRYKPIAIRSPALVAFLGLFVLCIVLIEYLLSISTSEPSPAPASTDLQGRQLSEHIATACPVQASSLESTSTSPHSQLSNVYNASSTASLQSWQSSFGQWRNEFDSIVWDESVLVSCIHSAPCTSLSTTRITTTSTIVEVIATEDTWVLPSLTVSETPSTIVSHVNTSPEQTHDDCVETNLNMARQVTLVTDHLAICSPLASITHSLTMDSNTISEFKRKQNGPYIYRSDSSKKSPHHKREVTTQTPSNYLLLSSSPLYTTGSAERLVSNRHLDTSSNLTYVNICDGIASPATVETLRGIPTVSNIAPSTSPLTGVSAKKVINKAEEKRSDVQDYLATVDVWHVDSSTQTIEKSQVKTTSTTTESGPSTLEFVSFTRYTTLFMSTTVTGQVTRSGVIVVVSNVTLAGSSVLSAKTSSASTSVHPGPSSDSSVPNPRFEVGFFEVVVKGTFTDFTFFTARYLVPILAVFIKAYGECIVSSLKLMEPFHRLSSASGATSSTSISSEYLSSSLSRDAINALREGHLLTIWSLIMHVLLTTATPLATSAMIVKTRNICTSSEATYTCDPAWLVNTIFLRSVEGILIVCFILVLILIFSTWHYYIDLSKNPSSVASIVSLLNHPTFLLHLRQLDPEIQDSAFAKALSNHLFWLGLHEDENTRRETYGIVAYANCTPQISSHQNQRALTATLLDYRTCPRPPSVRPPSKPSSLFSELSPRIISTLKDLLQILTTIALLTFLSTYYFNNQPDSFNAFFNSQTRYPRLLLNILAVVIDIQIKELERVTRITEPYRRLSLHKPRPETTIDLTVNGTCWSNLPHCLYHLARYRRNGHMMWQTIVTTVACLSDFNIIMVGSVPQDDAMTRKNYQACTYGSVIITGLNLLVILTTMIWWRNTYVVKNMPRKPGTIGSACGYLCGSKLVKEANESYNGDVSLMLSVRRRYTFGKMECTDGKQRWCIDIENERNDQDSDGGYAKCDVAEGNIAAVRSDGDSE